MPQSLRIAFVDHSHELGGAEHLLLILIEGLPKDRFDPLIITPCEGPFTQEARERNIRTLVCSLPPFWSQSVVLKDRKLLNPLAAVWNTMSALYSAWKLQSVLRKHGVNLVQTNSTFAHIYGGIAARLTGVPCIWYFHDLIEPNRLYGVIAAIWRTLAILLNIRVVAVSKAVLQALSVRKRGIVIYAGKSPAVCSTSSSGLLDRLNVPEDSKLVVFIGRITYSKGLDILAHAAPYVIRHDPTVHFVIVGAPGEKDVSYRQWVVSTISRLQMMDHWHWTGYVKRANSFLADATMLVLPSRREALPLVLVEAGMAKKAVVASRIGGIPEVVIDGTTGLLVPPEDPKALAEAILYLIRNPEKATRMGQKAYDHVRQMFELDRYHSEFLTVYESFQHK